MVLLLLGFYWFDGSSTEKEALTHFGKTCKTTSVREIAHSPCPFEKHMLSGTRVE